MSDFNFGRMQEGPAGEVKSRRGQKSSIVVLFGIFLVVSFALGYGAGYFVYNRQKIFTVSDGEGTESVVVGYNASNTIDQSEDGNSGFHAMMRDGIDNRNIETVFKKFTLKTHRAGDPNSKAYADGIVDTWKKAGLEDVEIKEYKVMLSEPAEPGYIRVNEKATGAEVFRSAPNETVLIPEEDVENIVAPFNSFAASGDVTGEVVYVNYGTMDDFLYLRQNKIELKGKIALIRFGRIFRANKVRLAEQAGAIGVVMFTDKADYALGSETYPQTWWLPPDGVQRGTLNLHDADYQSLGVPAIDGIHRTPVDKVDTPQIPVQPISYSDAANVLRHMDGPTAPDHFQGGMDVTYRLYSTPQNSKTFNLKVNVVKKPNTPIYNVIGKIRGHTEPDRYIILGNHHDSWVKGAMDPTSGSAVQAEVIRSAAAALKQGWKPRRSILFCSWDAEEYGLIGSVEWIEDNAALVRNQVVAYLNLDEALEGNYTLEVHASSQIATVLFEAAGKVQDPHSPKGVSLLTTWSERSPDKSHPGLPSINIPGSGSDFKTFFTRFGIPVTDTTYTFNKKEIGDVSSYPDYHTLHDTYYIVKKFVDPDFKIFQTNGKLWVTTMAILADRQILPFDFNDYAKRLDTCQREFITKYSSYLDTAHMKEFLTVIGGIAKFKAAAKLFHQIVDSPKTHRDGNFRARMINDKMMAVERAFITPKGLPDRPYTKHVLYGPSHYNNYIGDCFPALMDDLFEIKYYGRKDDERTSNNISQIYYHLLQAIQALTFE